MNTNGTWRPLALGDNIASMLLHRTVYAALAIVVAGAVIGCGQDAARSQAPPPTSGPRPQDARPWPGIVWLGSKFVPVPLPTSRLVAVASDGSVVVAVGYDDDGAVRSGRAISMGQDGTFAPAVTPDVMARLELVDVTAGPRGFVAIGTEVGNPSQGVPNRVALLTSDDGGTWRRVPDDPMFADAYAVGIAEGPGGLLAIGASESGADQPIWRSIDGTEWARVAAADFGLPGTGLAALEGSPDRSLGIGSPQGAVVVDSVDGKTWHATSLPPTGRPQVKPPIVNRAVAGRWGTLATGFEAQDCGFLIWEGDCAGLPAAWWSDGLGDWGALGEDSFVVTHPAARIVAAADHGFVAVSGAGSWASIDGITWFELSTIIEPGVDVLDVVVLGDRIIAVGEVLTGDGRSSDGWIGVGGECCN